MQGRVLSGYGDAYFGVTSGQVLEVYVERLRPLVGALRQVDVELLGNDLDGLLAVEEGRHPVDGIRVRAADHAVLGDVAEEADLLADVLVQGYGGAADHDVRLNTQLEQRLDAVLRGFGLQFPRGLVVGHLRDVDRHDVVPSLVVEHLPGGLDEMDVLDIPDGAADLDDQDVVGSLVGLGPDQVLDLARHVGHDLYVPSQVLAPSLLVEDDAVHLAGSDVVVAVQVVIEETLVGAQVHVALGPVFEDEDLAVAVGIDGAGVLVQIAVDLDLRYRESVVLEQVSEGSAEDALAHAGHDAAGDEDVLGAADAVIGGEELDGFGIDRPGAVGVQVDVVKKHTVVIICGAGQRRAPDIDPG